MNLNKIKVFYILTMLLLGVSTCFYLFAQDVNSDNKKNNISRIIVNNHEDVQKKIGANFKEIIKEEEKRKAEEEKRKAEEEKRKVEEEKRKVEEEKRRKEAEAKRKAEEAEAKRKAEEAARKKAAEAAKKKEIEKSKNNISTQNCELLFTYEDQLLCYVNNVRVQNGLNKLTLNKNLNKSASIRAKEIVSKFEHVRPNGGRYNTTITISHTYSGENIAAGQTSAKQVFNEWMASEGHKKNILSPNYKQMGIFLHEDPTQRYRYYWCQLFIG